MLLTRKSLLSKEYPSIVHANLDTLWQMIQTQRQYTCKPTYLPTYLSVYLHSFIHPSTFHSFTHPFIRSFTHSFINDSIIRSLINSFKTIIKSLITLVGLLIITTLEESLNTFRFLANATSSKA